MHKVSFPVAIVDKTNFPKYFDLFKVPRSNHAVKKTIMHRASYVWIRAPSATSANNNNNKVYCITMDILQFITNK